jgi:hypothetical protein
VAELTEIVRSISRRIAEVGLGDKQAILDQYACILRLHRLASIAPKDKAWTRDALDVRNRFTFDCAEGHQHRGAHPHAQQRRRQLRR